MSSGFGAWYQEQKAQENEQAPHPPQEDGTMLPLWGDTSQYSFTSMRSSMEAQMPQKIILPPSDCICREFFCGSSAILAVLKT